jgi:S1-C subfamily serine protease
MAMSGYTLGVLPDYSFSGPGFRITGTSEGKLGAKMGLKAGDVIININGMNIKDIYDYMESLNSLKKGGTVQVTVLRDGKPLTVQTAVE